MGSSTATRVLLLVVAVLAASLTGVITSWVTRSVEPNNGRAIVAGGAAFGGTLALLITAFNFVMQPDA
ncbi:hypothetical protein [Micromonospora sp. NPDC005197]|uniref:hypothetical protein n=1 Tax=Micromonospora sp. NPDC005197 TaxID=3157020 RepID=UPI0033B9BECE